MMSIYCVAFSGARSRVSVKYLQTRRSIARCYFRAMKFSLLAGFLWLSRGARRGTEMKLLARVYL